MNKFNFAVAISILKQSKQQNCLYCLIPYSFFIFNFLKLLKKKGFIYGFSFFIKTTQTLQKKRVFIVYLKSNQNILNFDFKLASTPSRKLYISSSKLLDENKKNLSNNFIISTNNKGLILAVNQKIGGKVLCKII